jgi:hypothetical protein
LRSVLMCGSALFSSIQSVLGDTSLLGQFLVLMRPLVSKGNPSPWACAP